MEQLISGHKITTGYRTGKQRSVVSSDLALQIRPGKFTCLIGPNGSGKTTLLSTIAGLIPSLEGEITLNQKRYRDYTQKELAQKIGVVLTGRIQPGYASVYSSVAIGRIPHTNLFGKLTNRDHELIEQSIRLCNIEHLRDRQVSELSDGELQKVLIARTLAQDTDIMILDEPTAFLDIQNRAMIVSLLRDLSHKHGKTILGSFHDLNLSLQAADEIWVMNASHELIVGDAKDLIQNGTIANTFAGTNINFNPDTGTFELLLND